MKGVSQAVFALCLMPAFLTGAAWAQTGTPSRTTRQYSGRIQMHTTPITLQVPDSSLDMEKRPNFRNTDLELLIPETPPPESQFRPAGPRAKSPRDKQQNKNWILPQAPEKKEDNPDAKLTPKEETQPSGWGWLADDMRERQQEQEDKAQTEEKATEEEENEYQPRSALPEESKPKIGGTVRNSSFKPVSGSTATTEKERKKTEREPPEDEDERAEKRDGPTAVESPRNRTAADTPRDQKFGADASWGNENLWNKNATPAGKLPQTQALLSMSKVEPRKPTGGLELPKLNPEVGNRASMPLNPGPQEPAQRPSVTAIGFEPMPATPVHDLGGRSWDGGMPGRISFRDTAPSAPSSVTPPTQPLDSIRSLELQKPAASPWLR